MNIVFGTQVVNSIYIPLWPFRDERLTVNSIFKVRRNYKKMLRRSDLSSMLASQNYVRMFRNDENISKVGVSGREVSLHGH